MKLGVKIVVVLLVFFNVQMMFGQKNQKVINDSNTPLHLLTPDYNVPYEELTPSKIKQTIDKVLVYLEKTTPAKVVDKKSGKEISDYTKLDQNSQLDRGAFRLASYEWGVTYSGMLEAAKATGDERYSDYVYNRFKLLAEVAPHFKRIMDDYGVIDPQMKQLLTPHALDDVGAMCAAMIKYQREAKPEFQLRSIIDNYMNYIMYHEYRLSDGTFGRNRPQQNTLWLDDLYMSVPAIVQMGKLTGERKYYDEAVKQIKQFSERMFIKEKGLFMHGWVESMDGQHPAFFWGRANGWAFLTMTEVLDVLPESHPGYKTVLELYRTHAKGLASCQSGEGFWHQLLDRNDSYFETSATAIYTYCFARGINKGWLNPLAYGPVANLGWNAVATKVNVEGQVEGTCVGTGMAFDPAFYYYRPVNVYAAHGYGPVLLAGAEMINLINKFHPRFNDSAIQFYTKPQTTKAPIFSVGDSDIQAGSSRINVDTPVVFLIGDSTVKNGRGDGSNNQWGWGSFFQQYFDSTKVTVENHALGGRSSRTFITEDRWEKVRPALKPGDFLFIQFGHNDGGPLNTGRARASLKGIGNETETVIMERTGGPETVYTFGHYLRIYIRQAKAMGAIPVVLSPTPNNRWTDGKIARQDQTYAKWAKEVAEQENVTFIDLNRLSCDKCDNLGENKAKLLFEDSVHTNYDGAIMNCESIVEAMQSISGLLLNKYLIKK